MDIWPIRKLKKKKITATKESTPVSMARVFGNLSLNCKNRVKGYTRVAKRKLRLKGIRTCRAIMIT
jgi:hypothetical protein